MTTVTDITTQAASGLTHIDALLDAGPGWNWVAPARNTLFYTFALNDGNSRDIGSTISAAPVAFNATQQTAAVQALNRLTQITGITFVATTDGAVADLHFAAADIITSTTTAGICSTRRHYSFDGDNTIISYTADAYIYLDNANFAASNHAPTAGSVGYEMLLHELGHALGLKHPFSGSVRLSEANDHTANTLMSYNHADGPYSDYSPYDIAALMFLYGGDGLGNALGQGSQGQYLVGTRGADTLTGSSGNDVLEGMAGDDQLIGGTGQDTAHYNGPAGHYVVAMTNGHWSASDTSGEEGHDLLYGIERLHFSDHHLAIDIDGHAGTTAKVLGAVFGAAAVDNPAYVGIGLGLLDGGMSYQSLMQLALDVRLGVGASHQAVVTLLYTNVIGSTPSPDTLAFFTSLLDSGAHTPASLGVLAADTAQNAANINLVGLSEVGIDFV